MTPPRDTAAIEEAKAEALAAIASLGKHKAAVQADIERRDVAILKMKQAGKPVPDIARELDIPGSTVRQAIKSAIVRSHGG